MLMIISGVSFVFIGGRFILVNIDVFKMFGRGYIGLILILVIIMIIVVIVGYFLLKRINFGCYVYVVGGNEEVVRLCGVKVNKVIVKVYVLVGLLIVLVGIILLLCLVLGLLIVGDGVELDVIVVVVFGGINMMGGFGFIVGICIGVGIIGILGNGLNLLSVFLYN